MKKRILNIAIISVSIAAVCSFFYINAEKLIKYERKQKNYDTLQYAENAAVSVNSIPENIPYSDEYRMYLHEGCITVHDSSNSLQYRSEIKDITAFTEKDIKQLETDGIPYTVRSELIEVLNYLRS